MEYIPLNIAYAPDVARLHISGINTGFISSLGMEFVTALYEAIAQSTDSFGLVAVKNDEVLGFIAFTTNLNSLYKYVIKTHGLKFLLLMGARLFSFKIICRVLQTLFYPSRIKQLHLSDAELLSIAVSDKARGRGIANELIKKGLEECDARGITEVKVLVAASNDPANKLYQKNGFAFTSQIDSHGITSNIYVAKTSNAL